MLIFYKKKQRTLLKTEFSDKPDDNHIDRWGRGETNDEST